MRVLIIGGVASGMSAATRLRRLDEAAEIVVYEMGDHVSYANCGLPYFVSDVISNRDELLLQTPQSLWLRFRIEVKVNTRVTSIDRNSKTIESINLVTGEIETSHYDKLVITTGATPRKLAIPGFERTLSLRDVKDADKLKAEIVRTKAKTATVLGGGFIGIELAENLTQLGIAVTVVQRAAQILSNFDAEMIEPMQQRLEQNGINLELHVEPIEITATSVVLTNGKTIKADLVISAAGVTPDNHLAKTAGLMIGKTGGLQVNDKQQTSDEDIFAAGDAVEKQGELTGNSLPVSYTHLRAHETG
jgi:NADPH-dependent 2,4-dienoyl-CoA reductase/sulfur reductase-like enzyme